MVQQAGASSVDPLGLCLLHKKTSSTEREEAGYRRKRVGLPAYLQGHTTCFFFYAPIIMFFSVILRSNFNIAIKIEATVGQ